MPNTKLDPLWLILGGLLSTFTLAALPVTIDDSPRRIPNTPAGQVLRAWLEAFNTGDAAQIGAFIRNFDPAETLGYETGLRHFTGGFVLVGITVSEPQFVKFVLKERNSDTHVVASIRVTRQAPIRVTSFGRSPVPADATADNVKLDSAEKHRVIQSAVEDLRRYYVYPETANKMADALLAHEKNGDYAQETDGGAFADLLTRHLAAVSHDRHLRVNYSPLVRPDGGPPGRPPIGPSRGANVRRDNCGVDKVEILPGNIGYLKLDAFLDPSFCRSRVSTAMASLTHASAIIFDLRDNGGGSPEMVALVCSYLFDRPTHINDLYDRAGNRTQQSWTSSPISGNGLADKPAYVLTSAATFSGAEEFTYDVKNLKRATIVGEPTGGGAHLTAVHEIDSHFVIGVPWGRPINPISKTDWEGSGVQPDVRVSAAAALQTAEELAGREVRKR